MAVIKPVFFNSIHDSEVNYTRPVSEETMRKMIQNCNMLAALAVIGSVRCVALNQQGVTVPNTDQWQAATGGQITHPQSPITSVGPTNRFTPDFTNRYIRGAAAPTVNGVGGAYTTNLEHDHIASTDCVGLSGEEGDEQPCYISGCHFHTIDNDLSATEPLEVAYQQVATYLKIN